MTREDRWDLRFFTQDSIGSGILGCGVHTGPFGEPWIGVLH
jgi:hypothetical protein